MCFGNLLPSASRISSSDFPRGLQRLLAGGTTGHYQDVITR